MWGVRVCEVCEGCEGGGHVVCACTVEPLIKTVPNKDEDKGHTIVFSVFNLPPTK